MQDQCTICTCAGRPQGARAPLRLTYALAQWKHTPSSNEDLHIPLMKIEITEKNKRALFMLCPLTNFLGPPLMCSKPIRKWNAQKSELFLYPILYPCTDNIIDSSLDSIYDTIKQPTEHSTELWSAGSCVHWWLTMQWVMTRKILLALLSEAIKSHTPHNTWDYFLTSYM